MPNLNRIDLMGHVGQEAELRYTPNGKPVSNFSLAVNNGKKKPDGTYTDDTLWFRVNIFGDYAERISERIKKGVPVYVSGRFDFRTYDRKDGGQGTSLEVLANTVEVLEKRERDETRQQTAPASDQESLPFE